MFKDFGRDMQVHILSDATAAIGICRRQGLGRIRHLAVADLWCQQIIRDKGATISKWPGPQNPADLFTKHLSRNEIIGHLGRMSMVVKEGRSPIALIRQGTEPCLSPHEFDKDCNAIQQCDDNEGSHESFVDRGQMVGLGGCPKSTHAYTDRNTCSALAWYDMIEYDTERPNRPGDLGEDLMS